MHAILPFVWILAKLLLTPARWSSVSPVPSIASCKDAKKNKNVWPPKQSDVYTLSKSYHDAGKDGFAGGGCSTGRCCLCLRVLERVCGLEHAPLLLMATCLLCTSAMRRVEALALTTVVVASREQGILVMIASQLQTAVLSFDGPGGAEVRARTRPRVLLHSARSLSR